MPAFNEERTLEVILDHVLDRSEVGEIIVIDDGSTDCTWEILGRIASQDSRVQIFKQPANRGEAKL
jgi:glycosyltransferase involved in cell wall biosynthesis